MYFNLICFGVASFMFICWTIERARVYKYKHKFLKAINESQRLMVAYYGMGKEAGRIRIKYNILFNTLITSEKTFSGDFAEFKKWADKEGLASFGSEKILDIKEIVSHYHEYRDEVSKICNE